MQRHRNVPPHAVLVTALLILVSAPHAWAGTPFHGSPAAVPGTFQAEDFDLGGEGVAYHDLTPGNQGGKYRLNEDVDIYSPAAGTYAVNNFQTGEWLQYTINVAQSGSYRIEPKVSSQFTTSSYHISIDGANVTGSVVVPNTGLWTTYQYAGVGGISLTAGQHVLRITADQQYFNIDAIRVTASAAGPTLASLTVSPSSVTGGTSATGTVTLSGPAPAGGAGVLSSTNTAAATVPTSVTVPSNQTTATFTVTTKSVSSSSSSTIQGSYGSTLHSATITVQPSSGSGPALASLAVSPSSVTGGTSATGTVTLSAAAPAGGASVTLSSQNSAATVPGSVTVPANQSSATFTVTTSPVAPSVTGNISASYSGVTKSAALTVNQPVLTSLTLNPTTVNGGASSTGTVILSGPAPPAGAGVSLSSTNTAAATVPASVTVPSNQTTATFTVTTKSVSSSSSSTIQGSYGSTVQSATLTVTAASSASLTSLALNPTSVVGGNPSTGTVSLFQVAPSGGASIALSSNNTASATVPGSVTVLAGSSSATFTVTTQSVSASAAVTISAIYSGVTKTAALTVNPASSGGTRFLYVDAQSGSDSNSGLSSDAPWKTITQANNNVRAGDTVYLRGTFSNVYIHPSASGTAAAPITFRAWPGSSATFAGGLYDANCWLDGLSYITVDGITFQDATNGGVFVRAGSNHIVIQNCTILREHIDFEQASDNTIQNDTIQDVGSESANNGDSIWISNGSSRNQILGNTITNGGHSLITIGGDKVGDAEVGDNVIAHNVLSNPWAMPVALNWMARRTLIEYNQIKNATQHGVNYPRAGISVMASDNIIRYNEIAGNTGGGITLNAYIYGGSIIQDAISNQIYNNTIYGNGGPAIEFWMNNDRQVANNLFANNICYKNTGTVWNGQTYTIWIEQYHNSTSWPAGSLNGNQFQNNLFLRQPGSAGESTALVVNSGGTNNLSYTIAGFQAAYPGVANNLEVNPLFVNEAASDFHLQPGSPAIDKGMVISGNAYAGAAPDIGAYEYGF